MYPDGEDEIWNLGEKYDDEIQNSLFKHWRDHRSIHQNIIPAATGACKALGKIIPQVKDKMTGLAFRVPTVNVSVLDITIRLQKNTSIENIIMTVEDESVSTMKNIIKVSKDNAVSSDFLRDENSCILDANSSLQLTNHFFKLICWYENEYSYACRVVETIKFSENQLNKPILIKSMFRETLDFKRPRFSESVISEKPKHEFCCYHFHAPTLICSTSQETALKNKTHKPHTPFRKTTLRPTDSSQTSVDRDNWMTKDVVKVWNDNETPKHHRNALFSRDNIEPSNTFLNRNTITKQRLEHVKREFTKMVNMTEDLLKKSNSEKSQQNIVNNTSKRSVKDDDPWNKKEHAMSGDHTSNKTYLETNESNLNKEQSTLCQEDQTSHEAECEKQVTFTESKFILYSKQSCSKAKFSENFNTFDKPMDENKLINKFEETKPNEDLKITEAEIEKKPEIEENSPSIKSDENENITFSELSTFKDQSNVECLISNIYYEDQIEVPTSDLNVQDNLTGTQTLNNSICSELKQEEASVSVTEKAISDANKIESKNIQLDCFNKGKEFKLKVLERIIKQMSLETVVVPEPPPSVSPATTDLSNVACRTKSDLYDKLDSVSGTDSDNSFQMDEKKSQVITITDLTNSIEDLARLDKLCRIMEISDELSNELFSALDDGNNELSAKKWSFKDLCERIKLDDFCNKVFAKSAS